MKRSALIFLVAIFLPSLVLGWLALRTAGEQGVIIERQAIDLHQAETDLIASGIRSQIEDRQRAFNEVVRSLLAGRNAANLAEYLGPLFQTAWSSGGVPFSLNPQGMIVYPFVHSQAADKENEFLIANSDFLNNRAPEELYQQQSGLISSSKSKTQISADPGRNIAPLNSAPSRQVTQPSKLGVSDFQTAVKDSAQGMLGRFVGDELQLIFWTKPDPSSKWLFGLILRPKELDAFTNNALPSDPPVGTRLAILNEMARPVARSPQDFTTNWKRPFVASEIGDMLPRWEVALYLTNPGKLSASARLVSITLVLLIALALAAILAGGYFVALDTRRQLALAQQRTDFVSNVSHELKTPLTSIRMFAELLAEDRVTDPAKRSHFLRIIAAESNRLTRLVNNVLNFAKLERKRKNGSRSSIDARTVIDSVWETEAMRLREAGFLIAREDSPDPCLVLSDADTLSQILVNLISNAEKYHGDRKEILLATNRTTSQLLISISDRGRGVPKGMEKKIFEPFIRGDDSLSSEVQGTGLGLTLARRMARDLGGDLTYRPRPDGGSTFTVHLPLSNP